MLDDQNVIGHLFDVEREAAELVSDAQDEYNRRIAVAREKADAAFKESYDAIVQKEEQRYKTAIDELALSKKTAFEAYCTELRGWKQDSSALYRLLDSLLFTAEGSPST